MNKRGVSLFILLLLVSCTNRQETFIPTSPPEPPVLMDSWHPSLGNTLQLQFVGTFDDSVETDAYDLDLFDTESATIADLHARGKRVICYLSAGSWEDWRPDADLFPREVIGNSYAGWPGEKWLDIRQLDKLQPIMSARLDLCASRGFDGVEPDNVEVLGNDTGFPITYQDQLAYALWLAEAAHARGLVIGLKNASQMVDDVIHQFDFSIVEDCFEYGWCADMSPFIQAGKPVFAIEYTDAGIKFQDACAQAGTLGLSMILKHRNLDAYRLPCP